ncbi:MAG: hypothetical protein QW699_04525 [Metallosphaera sp.]
MARERARAAESLAVVRETAVVRGVVRAGSIQRAPLDLKLRPVGLGLKSNSFSSRHPAYNI